MRLDDWQQEVLTSHFLASGINNTAIVFELLGCTDVNGSLWHRPIVLLLSEILAMAAQAVFSFGYAVS